MLIELGSDEQWEGAGDKADACARVPNCREGANKVPRVKKMTKISFTL